MITRSTIIFGGIGVLVETSDIQRRAFNDAFVMLGIDFEWSEQAYRDSLSGTGGQSRLSVIQPATGPALTPTQIAAIHDAKTKLFDERVRKDGLLLRAGVVDLIAQSSDAGITLAWATTTSKSNVDAIIAATDGALTREIFAYVGSDEAVTRQKPDPQIYEIIFDTLAITSDEAVAIEDSLTGINAALSAGLRTIAFPGEWNQDKDFGAADALVTSLDRIIDEHFRAR